MLSPVCILRLTCSLLLCCGCVATPYPPVSNSLAPSSQFHQPATSAPQVSNATSAPATQSDDAVLSDRLIVLWRQRMQSGTIADYPLGPGDVLDIAVPAMEELQSRTVRVSGEGTISLPFVGIVQVSGLTEEKLREEIRHRLEQRYMYNPQVNVFVREYRSRQVAVTGAVQNPGLYNLASGTDTLFDMISLAGGMTKEAAPRILFLPAELGTGETASQIASAHPLRSVGAPLPSFVPKNADPIVIDLKHLTLGGNQVYMTMPARPGDVLIVPNGGEVLVEGWVERPGSYPINQGLTVVGVVAAAGGPLFPANTSAVRIIRSGKEGESTFFVADLEKIKRGESPDIVVQQGDLIEVSSSTAKLIPYGFYDLTTRVLHFGAQIRP